MSAITVIIPCYNEATRLPVAEYRQFLSAHEDAIIFVNDGSSDKTLDLLYALKEEYPLQVAVLDLEKNSGKAEAIRQGMLWATHLQHDSIIGFMDADLATPFGELIYFKDAFKDTRLDFVFGSRIARIGANIQRYQARHYLGRVIATFISNYLRLPVNDSQCGAKFFHAGFARQLFAEPFVSRWLFDVEIFRRISLLGIKVDSCTLELPLHTWIEKGGSKLVLRDIVKLPWEFYKVMNYYADKRNCADISLLYRDIGEQIYSARLKRTPGRI